MSMKDWMRKNPGEIHWCSIKHIRKHLERAGFFMWNITDQFLDYTLLSAGYQRKVIPNTFNGYIVHPNPETLPGPQNMK